MLLWFRNDVRIHDNPALHYFLSKLTPGEKGKALFFVSEQQWKNHDWSDIKIDFIKRHIYSLVAPLTELNIELDIVYVDNFNDQIAYLSDYCRQHQVEEVVANSELEVNELERDQACLARGLPLTLLEADVIVPKGKVLNQSGQMFKVFTPFKRAWLKYVKAHGFKYLGKINNQTVDDKEYRDADDITDNASKIWPLAPFVEQHVIPHFLSDKISLYAEQRDVPSIKGTSGLSPYLAIGAISPRYLLTLLINKYPDILNATDSPSFSWLNELIWREFYRHLIFHQPNLCKHQCFNVKYQQTVWPNNADYFKAWCDGKTGYPLVDAAMRQLNQTGWMHNRLRMVVASFLTKHLLIDWRWGEKYFMQHLIDGDLAANNGGWQWAASTGCDAQPYFRIFNPIRQSERFDPNGDFIRKCIPELANIPGKEIHFPHRYIAKNNLDVYWPAIVEHKQARELALAFYK